MARASNASRHAANRADSESQSAAKPYLVLGLDIGIASLGWCLLDIANCEVVDMGVHLWESVQVPKTKESKAAVRRAARSQRRNTKRHRDRMKRCLVLLADADLVPAGANAASLQKARADTLTPLQARVAALDSLVTDRQLAQALYNICNRRGYIPHGEGTIADTEGRKVLKALDANTKLMEENGWRTVGEMMLRQGEATGRPQGVSRNHGGDYSRCVTMEQLLSEVDAIFEAQRRLGNPKATEELQESFKACMSWERPADERDARVYGSVGECVYGLGKRAASACPSSERCRAFERLGHARIVMPDGSETPLPAEVRRWAMRTMFSIVELKGNKACKVTYGKIRKRLGMSASARFKGIPSDREGREVFEPKAWRKMCEVLSHELMLRLAEEPELADAVAEAVAYASSETSLRARLDEIVPGMLSDGELDEVCKLPYASPVFNGYGTRSVTALQMLCDAFEDVEGVMTLADAEKATGLGDKRRAREAGLDGDVKGKVLPPYKTFDPTCSNPVVLRAMGRVRKLVNAVVREHGMPDEVHVELANELKKPKRIREQIDKRNRERESARKRIAAKAAEELGCDPGDVRPKLVRKLELWHEQGGRDVYTDRTISRERLLADDSYCQIDHILPWSRTCDDNWANKVLVLGESNQEKGQRTPFEWLSGTGEWDGFKARVMELERGGYPAAKARRLLEVDLDGASAGFIERSLNDTRYASRQACLYIKRYLDFPANPDPSGKVRSKRLCAVSGGATHALRHAWGLGRKDRAADDLHHAVDAAVIAACREREVVKVAKYSETKRSLRKEDRGKALAGTQPWEGFAGEVLRRAQQVVPTRKPEHGLSGRLFEDTVYSFCGLNAEGTKGVVKASGKKRVSGNYVVRADRSAVLPDGLAFLRLWWDPGAGKTGKYLAEPVYYADLPAALGEDWVPGCFTRHMPRCDWAAIPARVRNTAPVILFAGDAVAVSGRLRRFKGFGIDTGTWLLSDPTGRLADGEATKGLSFSKVADPGDLVVVAEDLLGRCFEGMDTAAAS